MEPQDWGVVAALGVTLLALAFWGWFRWTARKPDHRNTRTRSLWMIFHFSKEKQHQLRAMEELFKRDLSEEELQNICFHVAPMNERLLGEKLVELLLANRSSEAIFVLGKLACGAFEEGYAAECATDCVLRELTFTEKLDLRKGLVLLESLDSTDYEVALTAQSLISSLTSGRNGVGAGVQGAGATLELQPWSNDADIVERFLDSIRSDNSQRNSWEA